MPIPGYRPTPAPPGIFQGLPLPECTSNWVSRVTFQWVAPIMKVGYSRPLEANDLWTLTDDLQCQNIANDLEENFLARVPPSKRPSVLHKNDSVPISNEKPDSGPYFPGLSKKNTQKATEGKIAYEDGKIYDTSLLKAMYWTIWRRWWLAVFLKACGAVLQVTSPLVTRLIIAQISAAHAYHSARTAGSFTDGLEQPKSIGYGVGLAVALFGMLMVGSLLVYQALQMGSVIGFMMRSALIDLIGLKALRLSSKSRLNMTNGKLTTMVSADASFLDFSAPMTLDLVVQPLQIVVGMALIIYTLGYSALVGLAVLALAGPIQACMFAQMVKYRQAQLVHVDARVRLLSEVVENIRAVKLYAYRTIFGEKVGELRKKELAKLRVNGFNRATMNATMAFIPTLAAVLTFITYGLTGHELDAAIIFSGLQFFNVLKTPIAFLPMVFAAVSDAVVAIGRIGSLLQSDEMPVELTIDAKANDAIDVHGSFTFEQEEPEDTVQGENEKTTELERPFCLQDVDIRIPKGALVCVIGRVGVGKSALLAGLLGEMKQTTGHTTFSGPVTYAPQSPWIHSGTIRDNITFSASSAEIDFARLEWVIETCGLQDDIKSMANGLATPVGEKGITLSGGQRQRIALARAAYDDTSSIVLLDDPLSAVDGHVGHQILHGCILHGPLADRTRVMITHNLDHLSKADQVIVMDRDERNIGRIVQQGSYHDLCRRPGILRGLIGEFAPRPRPSTVTSVRPRTQLSDTPSDTPQRPPSSRRPVTLVSTTGIYVIDEPTVDSELDEERETGAVSWDVYRSYIRATGSWFWVITAGILLVMTQVTNVANSLFLGWWSSNEFGFGENMYMTVYACLGIGVAIFTWAASFIMFVAGLSASYTLFNRAWHAVLRAPTSWHDKTPSGRIISRLSKDIEMLDDRLAFAWEQFLITALAVVGTFGLVLYAYPYLGIAFIPLTIFFYLAAGYYRQTSREIKRVDSITRSKIYSSFGEQLSGLSVIRAFRKQGLFEHRLQAAINTQCQAYIITLSIQRWLGVRLDLFSNLLVMLIAIFGCVFRDTVDPAKFGVVLTYTLSAASLFANLVSLYAQVEQEMNNAERILHYTTLPPEAAPILPTDPLGEDQWPKDGGVSFRDVWLRYAPDLPCVLKGLRFDIAPGEKIGVIGRTGAGKSSIAQALFRMVEVERGRIIVDKRDIRHMGLDTLRSKLAVIPQDAFLFEGTVRDNIDPKGLHSDDELNRCLHLIHTDPGAGPTLSAKLRLDGEVAHEGSNFSAGEKQLLALVRALLQGSKVLLLDEATSSVDPETDALIQRIIQAVFKDTTLISIAHRLQTIAYYDRIMVLDAGRIVEFDSPVRLYDRSDSIFRSLCDRARLRRQDLLRIRHDASFAEQTARDRSSLMCHFTIADMWAELQSAEGR